MAKYLAMAKNFLTKFRVVKIEQVGRDLNSHVDALASLASIFEGETGQTIAVVLISAPSLKILHESILVNTELGLSWIDSIINFVESSLDFDDNKTIN